MMKNQCSFGPITADTFFQAMQLWTTVPPYNKFPCDTINNRLIPAYYNQQMLGWYDGSVLRAFITWAFMTDQEFETREYWGPEIFARRDGEKLVIVDMIAPGGKNDVLSISRDVRRFMKKKFPHVKNVYAHRGPRNGVFPNKGG
jgi:hemolysin-activating ACP:hemolysin acyltransferase